MRRAATVAASAVELVVFPDYFVAGMVMMRKFECWNKVVAICLGLVIAGGTVVSVARAEEEGAKPKHTIKEVMKLAHKDGLLKKVTEGQASDAEKKQLLDLYVSMVEAKPEKGSEESWHKLAGSAAMAAAKVVVGREDGVELLKTTTNCKACHDVHK
jgi:hypothetical protein